MGPVCKQLCDASSIPLTLTYLPREIDKETSHPLIHLKPSWLWWNPDVPTFHPLSTRDERHAKSSFPGVPGRMNLARSW
jgi:hypothetical protein